VQHKFHHCTIFCFRLCISSKTKIEYYVKVYYCSSFNCINCNCLLECCPRRNFEILPLSCSQR